VKVKSSLFSGKKRKEEKEFAKKQDEHSEGR